jgi:hypothetical protein
MSAILSPHKKNFWRWLWWGLYYGIQVSGTNVFEYLQGLSRYGESKLALIKAGFVSQGETPMVETIAPTVELKSPTCPDFPIWKAMPAWLSVCWIAWDIGQLKDLSEYFPNTAGAIGGSLQGRSRRFKIF